MSRFLFFILICAFALVPASFAKERLNVILIMADDSAADNYGCYGSKFFSTPRLDALARTGQSLIIVTQNPCAHPVG